MALTIQERLKDLHVERRLTLEQFGLQTQLSKSALGSYEADDFKDISQIFSFSLFSYICQYSCGEDGGVEAERGRENGEALRFGGALP